MRATALSLALAVGAAVGCGGASGVTGPSASAPLPTFAGGYTLTVDASSVCRLPVSHFEWAVVASTADAYGGRSVQVTLPNGDASLDMSFLYAVAGDPGVVGNFETIAHGDGLAAPGGYMFNTNSVLYGTVSGRSGGRAVLTGQIHGDVTLLRPGQNYFDSGAQSCTAADHHWSLVGR